MLSKKYVDHYKERAPQAIGLLLLFWGGLGLLAVTLAYLIGVEVSTRWGLAASFLLCYATFVALGSLFISRYLRYITLGIAGHILLAFVLLGFAGLLDSSWSAELGQYPGLYSFLLFSFIPINGVAAAVRKLSRLLDLGAQ
jgi:hypothetical protein